MQKTIQTYRNRIKGNSRRVDAAAHFSLVAAMILMLLSGCGRGERADDRDGTAYQVKGALNGVLADGNYGPGWESREFSVAAGNPLATAAGYRILSAGGTAADAAIAIQLVLTLVEPQSSGIGGGAFVMHWDGDRVTAYNGRETAPARAGEDLFLDTNGQPLPFTEAVHSGLSVGVPGTLAVLWQVHQKHGRLPWAELFEPAIELAEGGFAVSERLHRQLQNDRRLRNDDIARALYYDEEGDAHPEGYNLRNPALAEVLRRVADEGLTAFYEGPVAANIVERVRLHERPGPMRLDDLSSYPHQDLQTDPICTPWRQFTICGFPPPSSGHLTVMQILGILEHLDMPAWQFAQDELPADTLPQNGGQIAVRTDDTASTLDEADMVPDDLITAPEADAGGVTAADDTAEVAIGTVADTIAVNGAVADTLMDETQGDTVPAGPGTIPVAPGTVPAGPDTIPATPDTAPAAPDTARLPAEEPEEKLPVVDLQHPVPSAGWLHNYLEASKLAYADRNRYIADPGYVEAPGGDWQRMLDPAYLAHRAAQIDSLSMGRAEPGDPAGDFSRYGTAPAQPDNGTSHISFIDRDGNAVSMTTTIEQVFGSRIMSDGGTGLPGGFHLNNELTDFSLRPVDDDGRQIANRVQPGKRPRSSMAPTLIFDTETGELLATLGSPGGAGIIHFVAKTILGMYDFGLNAQEAIDLPNFVNYNGPSILEQHRFPLPVVDALKARGHEVRQRPLTSGLQAIQRTESGFFGGADPRREGVVMGD